MNWYKKSQTTQVTTKTINPIIEQLLPFLKQAGITGIDKEELINVLNEEANNKFFVQKINNSPTYYEHDKNKLIILLKIIAENFPSLNIMKYWQRSLNGDSQEGYFVVNKNSFNNLISALKISASQGTTHQYHKTMGKIYGYKPEEIEEFISKEPEEIELPEKTVEPSLVIRDFRTNQTQKLI